MIVVALALLPVFILVGFLIWKDRFNPEPLSQILKALFFGTLTIPCSLFFSYVIGFYVDVPEGLEFHSVRDAFVTAFFGAAVPEESAKLLLFWLFLRHNPYFDERVDGIVYASCIALGFAGVENVMYLFNDVDDFLSLGVSRALTAVPGHMCDGVIMGYFYSMARFYKKRRLINSLLVWLAPVTLHCIYDFCLMVVAVDENRFYIFYILFLVFFIKLLKFSNRRIDELLYRDFNERD